VRVKANLPQTHIL